MAETRKPKRGAKAAQVAPKAPAKDAAKRPAAVPPAPPKAAAVLVALKNFVAAQRPYLASDVQDEADALIREVDKLL